MKLLIAGDYCPRARVTELINYGSYESVLGDVQKIVTDADYSIVNLECPVVEYDASLINKCGPNLRCSAKAVDAIKLAGFNCVTLANNHFYDYGDVGVKDTLSALKERNIDYVGGGVNLIDASQILYKEIAGEKLAIINCCEHEFSIATEHTPGSNPLNIVQQYYAIQEARKQADYVVVIVHGGVEHFWLPTERMKETYKFFVDVGADAVINHHQHCYSGYEVYKGKPIFYGLGNFCFDGNAQNHQWTSGYMVNLFFDSDKKGKFELLPYLQCADEPTICLMKGEEKEAFFDRIKEYNSIIADDKKNHAIYEQWCKQNEKMYKSALNPLYNRLTEWFFDGSLAHLLIGKKKWLYIKDSLVNESHIERVIMMVEKQISKCK